MKNLFKPPLQFFVQHAYLFLYALLILPCVKAGAQGKTPDIELVPVRQQEVMDHYLEKVWTDAGWQLKAYDGVVSKTFDFRAEALIGVSAGQRFFTVAQPVVASGGQTIAYDVELRDLQNNLLAKERLTALGREEAHDEFVPSNDGATLTQQAFQISGALHFILYERQAARLVRRLEVDQPSSVNSRLTICAEQQMIVATYELPAQSAGSHKSFVQCYSPDGALRWENTLENQYLKSGLFVSPLDGTVSFVSRDLADATHKNLFIYQKNGALLRQLPVYKGGLYNRSHYQLIKGRQYLISPSDGEFFYVIDLSSGEIVNRITQGKEGSFVTGVAMSGDYTVMSYFSGGYRLSANNIQEFAITERGLGIQDALGTYSYQPLEIAGEPFLIATGAGLFLREKLGEGINENNQYYKINLK